MILGTVVAAQSYPNRTVRIVVPIAAGGSTDVFARTLAAHFSEAWGQGVIVDNRPGAGGMIGSELVAKAPPDGYNLLMAYTSHVINPSLWTRLPYDTLRDFAPVTMVAQVPSVLIVHPSVPVKSVAELITFAKRRPHELDYGSSGVGTAAHLAAALFAQRAGLFLTHVPYKGGVPAMYELLGGQISIMFGSLATAIPNIRNGRVLALAVTSSRRAVALPEVRTMAEAALPGEAQQLELKTPVAGVQKAERRRGVVEALRLDVGHAQRVHRHPNRRVEAGDRRHRLRADRTRHARFRMHCALPHHGWRKSGGDSL